MFSLHFPNINYARLSPNTENSAVFRLSPFRLFLFPNIYPKRILVITVFCTLAARLSCMTNALEHNTNEQHEPLLLIDAVTLGRNVTRLRKQAKLTKQKFALMVGVGRPFLNRIESGTGDPRLSIIRRLADALETTPQDLLTDHEAQKASAKPAAAGRHHARLH